MSLVADQLSMESYFDNNYLERCQVETPDRIVKWVWSMVESRSQKNNISKVLDLGCGDGKFSKYGKYKKYLGVEVDHNLETDLDIPGNATIERNCALLNEFKSYDLCIGNPPYVRHHDMDSKWRDTIAECLSKFVGSEIDKRANAYLYFMLKSLVSTKRNGMVALVVPFEWVTRPSSKWLRTYIGDKKWSVSVYRLPEKIFPGVLTTSSLTIIDKSNPDGEWKYFNTNDKFRASPIANPSGTGNKVLEHSERIPEIFAQRGLSPGNQKIFCLTEEERLHSRLRTGADVIPCVTSMRKLPSSIKVLTKDCFFKHFVKTGARCWLIRSDKRPASRLQLYLDSVESALKDTSTCMNREVWFEFIMPKSPELLFATGFTKFAPHFVENKVGAIAVGSVAGIHSVNRISYRRCANYLRAYSFESRVVNHAGALKKVEINQMNTVLSRYYSRIK